MKPNQLTAIAFVLGCFILVAYDVLALVFWGADSTISVVLNKYAYFTAHPLMMFLSGCVAGGLVVHFLGWSPKEEQTHG